MSHFSTLVMIDANKVNIDDAAGIEQVVDEMMLPYMENCCATPPMEYMEFVEDEYCDVDEITGKKGYWQNPDAKWDWYVIGGRWDGEIPTKNGENVNVAYVGDINCDIQPDEEENARKFWHDYVEGNDPDYEGFVFYKPEFYKDRYENADNYVACTCGFGSYAVVTSDGVWHEKGEMGWFGMSSETDEEAVKWERSFSDTFFKDVDDKTIAVMVDCHI